jgi:hypothetical protein
VSQEGVVSGTVYEVAPARSWTCGGTVSGDSEIVCGNSERCLTGTLSAWRATPGLPYHLQGDMTYTRPAEEGGTDAGPVDMTEQP